ncbi:MAG: glycosyltransferase [Saprospiraceae bacterium]
MDTKYNIVIIGLTLSSSWGNGHATTYRGLVRELTRQGHRVLFLEQDMPWYANHRDLPNPHFYDFQLYSAPEDLKTRFKEEMKSADLVIVGSYVQQGVKVGTWVNNVAEGITAFYDIDTPVTMRKLGNNDYEYLHPDLIPRYDIYLSFTGGPMLDFIETHYKSPMARALYCSVDPNIYYPEDLEKKYDLGYLGTYSEDRQPALKKLMLDAAKRWQEGRFVIAGPNYPDSIDFPANVQHIEHLPPAQHRYFYNAQRFTLNITRADMIAAGYSPSVRLFEAAACGIPIISDFWEGLDTLFTFNEEILIAKSKEDTLKYLTTISETERRNLGERARQKVLQAHTAAHRAYELIAYLEEVTQATVKKNDRI